MEVLGMVRRTVRGNVGLVLVDSHIETVLGVLHLNFRSIYQLCW